VDLLAIRWLPLEPASDGRASPTVAGEIVPDERWHGPPGLLHGGMAAALLDECMGALSHGVDKMATVTVTLDLRYRLPVPLDGRAVRLEAWREDAELRRRNRVHGRLLLAGGEPAVEATALMLSTGQAV
jgi:acyl-coenzyme A thioesterase PaaI-like protein